MDHVAQDGDDVEFLAVDPRDVRDRKAIAGEIGRHLVLEDKTGMDLETLTAAQMDVLEGVEEAGAQVDIADQKSARLDEWLEIVRGLGELTRDRKSVRVGQECVSTGRARWLPAQ